MVEHTAQRVGRLVVVVVVVDASGACTTWMPLLRRRQATKR